MKKEIQKDNFPDLSNKENEICLIFPICKNSYLDVHIIATDNNNLETYINEWKNEELISICHLINNKVKNCFP